MKIRGRDRNVSDLNPRTETMNRQAREDIFIFKVYVYVNL